MKLNEWRPTGGQRGVMSLNFWLDHKLVLLYTSNNTGTVYLILISESQLSEIWCHTMLICSYSCSRICVSWSAFCNLHFSSHRFYSEAALLANRYAERCNSYCNSVCPSDLLTHAGTLSRRMNIGSHGLHCDVAKTLVFWWQQWLEGDVPFHLKFVLKVTHPLCNAPTSTNICL